MPDATDRLPQPDVSPAGAPLESGDSGANRQRLLVINPPASRTPRDTRPVANLATVFGRFAEIQHQVGDQLVALEDCVGQQEQQLADVAAQLPDMRERINWLIASYYEDVRDSQTIRERLERQEAALATLTDAVRGLCEAQAQWRETIERLMQVLGRAQTPAVPTPPRWGE